MKARCESDGTVFDASERIFYQNRYFECPTCYRRYFQKGNGGDFFADRSLTLIPENLDEAIWVREDLRERMMESSFPEAMDKLHLRYIEACNDCEGFKRPFGKKRKK